jgi:hypothetical protein
MAQLDPAMLPFKTQELFQLMTAKSRCDSSGEFRHPTNSSQSRLAPIWQHPTQSGNPHGATGHRKAAIQNPQLISVNDSKVAV